MGYVTWRIDKTPFVAGVFNEAGVETLTSYHDPILEVNLGEGKDSYSFKVLNVDKRYSGEFGNNDKVTIRRVVNSDSVPTTIDPIMIGIVRDVPNEYTARKNTMTVKGYNFSEALMEALCFVDGTTKTPPEVLQEALTSVSNFNSNFSVEWEGTNPSTKSDTTAFPNVGKKYLYTPLRKVLEELSTNTFTKDGEYYWYVNNQNKLIWKKGTSYTSGIFNETVNPFLSLKIGKDTKDIRNYYIMKGGSTPSGRQIQTYVPDYASIAKHGFKFHIIVSQAKYAQERNESDIKDSYGTEGSPDRYPDLSTTFQTTWSYKGKARNLSNGTALVDGVAPTINTGTESGNKVDYNEAIYWSAIESLIEEARLLLQTTTKGRIEVEIQKRPWHDAWALGQIIACTLAEFSTTPKEMRVQEIQYTTTVDTYTLKEDIGTL